MKRSLALPTTEDAKVGAPSYLMALLFPKTQGRPT